MAEILRKRIKYSKKTNHKKNTISVKRHDVLFELSHLQKLLNGDNWYDNVPVYMNRFFFKYKTGVVFDIGDTFDLLTFEEAKKKIPDGYTKEVLTKCKRKDSYKEYTIEIVF
jgi:hypothetical protein